MAKEQHGEGGSSGERTCVENKETKVVAVVALAVYLAEGEERRTDPWVAAARRWPSKKPSCVGSGFTTVDEALAPRTETETQPWCENFMGVGREGEAAAAMMGGVSEQRRRAAVQGCNRIVLEWATSGLQRAAS